MPSQKPQEFQFWKRRCWTRDSVASITAEMLLGFPYALWFAKEDAKKEV